MQEAWWDDGDPEGKGSPNNKGQKEVGTVSYQPF